MLPRHQGIFPSYFELGCFTNFLVLRTSQVPAATPFAEGVYAITSSGADSHLAYHVTVPSEIGEVQKELGLNEKGSYNISLKNPEAPSPAYATIGNPAKYSKDIQDQFRGRRWMPVIPEALEYEGSQFLLIGEGVDKALEIDGKKEEEKPADEMERLEEEVGLCVVLAYESKNTD